MALELTRDEGEASPPRNRVCERLVGKLALHRRRRGGHVAETPRPMERSTERDVERLVASSGDEGSPNRSVSSPPGPNIGTARCSPLQVHAAGVECPLLGDEMTQVEQRPCRITRSSAGPQPMHSSRRTTLAPSAYEMGAAVGTRTRSPNVRADLVTMRCNSILEPHEVEDRPNEHRVDPESCRMAYVHPRTRATRRWRKAVLRSSSGRSRPPMVSRVQRNLSGIARPRLGDARLGSAVQVIAARSPGVVPVTTYLADRPRLPVRQRKRPVATSKTTTRNQRRQRARRPRPGRRDGNATRTDRVASEPAGGSRT